MALYSYWDENLNDFYEKYYYSGGVERIKERVKSQVTSTLLGFKTKYKAPSGFKYGKNIEIKRYGKVVGFKQYACDFYGNKILVKQWENG